MKEMVGGCCVCSDERGWPDNPLVYCDGNGCTVAVHQACYGIVTVPTGPWFCRKCENQDSKTKVRCELCPSKSGALKLSDTGGWAHVVCALYIPEVRFGNVTSMEPIVLRLIPQERYNKICYICQEQGKSRRANAGACMQCNKSGCKQQFHVTCAQSLGLLCEEAGNYLDNVKYCGYCKLHYSKLKKTGNVKTIPPYKPISHDSQSSDSSGDKDGEASPLVSGSGTPTHSIKPKNPSRKSSQTTSSSSGKYTPSGSKTPTSNQPSRRQSLEETKKAASSGKTPSSLPSPQDSAGLDPTQGSISKATFVATPGGSSRTTSPLSSPGENSKNQEVVGVISSITSVPTCSPSVTAYSATSVVQTTSSAKPILTYQESVITNTESIDNKFTKKRKAVVAASVAPTEESSPSPTRSTVDNSHLDNSDTLSADGQMEPVVKIVKKTKTPGSDNTSYPNLSPVQPPQSSPRHIVSPNILTGMSEMSNLRSPSEKTSRDRETASLLISVPLPSISQGLNLTTHQQTPAQTTTSDHQSSSPHIFHQVPKQTPLEQQGPSISHHMSGQLRWGGLKVTHEPQKIDINKSSMSGVNPLRDVASNSSIRNKKRPMTSTHNTTSTIQISNAQTLASKMLPSQPTPPPIYQENLNDSSSTSSSSEKPIYPKIENTLEETLQLKSERDHLEGQLTAELSSHASGSPAPLHMVPPPLFNRATQDSTSRGGKSSVSSAQGLDQLLERQWEQGSQFLMEQAEHFDIASLLSCLHQLRTDNVRLEEHVNSLLQRRDHLLAVNARLAIPLTAAGPSEPGRSSNENGPPVRGPGPYERKQ